MIKFLAHDYTINTVIVLCSLLSVVELIFLNNSMVSPILYIIAFGGIMVFIPKRFKEIVLLFSSAVCMFGLQDIIVSGINDFLFSSIFKVSLYQMVRKDLLLNWLTGLANSLPIFFSILLCCRFWEKLDAEIKGKEFNGSSYPTLMVAQGTFYTFLGVSVILFTYTASPENLANLLTGLKMAFITSVIGLIFSIAAKINLKQKINEFYMNKKFVDEKFLDELDFYKTIKEIEKNEDELLRKSINNEYILMEKNNSLLDENTMVLRNLSSSLSSAIDLSIKKNNAELIKNMKLVTKELTNDVKNVFEELQNNMEEIEKNCSSINKRMEEITATADSMGKSVAKDFEQIGKEVTELKEVFVNTQSDMMKSFEEKQEKVLDDFINVQKGYTAAFDENNRTINAALKTTTENIDGYSSKVSAFTENTEKHIEELNKSLENVGQRIDNGLVTFGQRVDNGLVTFGQRMDTSLVTFEQRMDRCVDYMDLLGKEITNTISLNNDALQKSLLVTGESVKKITSEFEQLRDKMDKCIDYVDLLSGEAVNNITRIKNEYVKYNDSYSESSRKLVEKNNTLLEKLDKCTTAYAVCQKSIDIMNENIKVNATQIETNLKVIADNIKSNGERYNTDISNAQQRYYQNLEATLDDSLNKTMDAIKHSVNDVCTNLRDEIRREM